MRLLPAAAVSLLMISAGPGPAAHAATPPELRSVRLTDANPVVTTGRCAQVAMTARISAPDTPWTSVTSTITRDDSGDRKDTLGLAIRRSGTSAAISDRVRLCGINAFPYEMDEPGRFVWTVSVAHAGGTVQVTRSFRLRFQGIVHLNARPEPVRAGNWVTLTSWVHDNWESYDTSPIHFYFRGTRPTAWTYKGSARPRCTFGCGEPGVQSWVATKRFRQYRSGTWRAVSTRTNYLETGSHSDAVTVRR
ncbi:hypothetical protein AB0368_11040 [Actinoplanes sp. NPDC051475]|uniref:hypothetical protein n=1 Tax=Actinoplanes sp. NPDC051475 TaxID=3157225 RepID=UPI00344E4598